MFKWLIGLLASVSAIFTAGENKQNSAPLLNTAIIAYEQTYYAPAVADLGNFPRAKKTAGETTPAELEKAAPPSPRPDPISTPPSPVTSTLPAPMPQAPTIPPQDSYLAIPEPIGINWLRMATFPNGHTLPIKGNNDQILSGFIVDREYWRMDVSASWVSPNPNAKIPVEENYFKLEVYEEGNNKLVYAITSGKEEYFYKTQIFKKPGKYYFKIYSHQYDQYEIDFFASPKIVL
ncbi:hypothetical protein HZB06_02795 [Candidatus Wolfebacteria bacterium]|nr:hypothetical protein [Candidatus Wolfebacteria bacterium]